VCVLGALAMMKRKRAGILSLSKRKKIPPPLSVPLQLPQPSVSTNPPCTRAGVTAALEESTAQSPPGAPSCFYGQKHEPRGTGASTFCAWLYFLCMSLPLVSLARLASLSLIARLCGFAISFCAAAQSGGCNQPTLLFGKSG
jgi:hypothetical protein